jgi:hypothetical protein
MNIFQIKRVLNWDYSLPVLFMNNRDWRILHPPKPSSLNVTSHCVLGLNWLNSLIIVMDNLLLKLVKKAFTNHCFLFKVSLMHRDIVDKFTFRLQSTICSQPCIESIQLHWVWLEYWLIHSYYYWSWFHINIITKTSITLETLRAISRWN